jgi:NitT/TauT family transport system ATP-binding protein
MTNPQAAVGEVVTAQTEPRYSMLPHARSGGISGLLEILDSRGGAEDLPALAKDLRLTVDDLLPAVDAAAMLGFAMVAQGDVMLTATGREFANAEVHRSHEIFREQVLDRIPLMQTLLAMCESKRDGRISKEFILDILDEHFSAAEAERQFDTLVDWGRYAQLFDYHADEERIYLDTAATT